MVPLSKQQIGKCGELLVQFELLKHGVESSPMTTDSGVDLVALPPGLRNKAVTIQVKTNLKPKPGGGRGKDALDWYVPVNNSAEYIALVDLKGPRVWLIPWSRFEELAQQKTETKYHFYMYVDKSAKNRPDGKAHRDIDFEEFLLERMIDNLRSSS